MKENTEKKLLGVFEELWKKTELEQDLAVDLSMSALEGEEQEENEKEKGKKKKNNNNYTNSHNTTLATRKERENPTPAWRDCLINPSYQLPLKFHTAAPPRWHSGKASASRAEDPGFQSRLRRDFFGVESYQ